VWKAPFSFTQWPAVITTLLLALVTADPEHEALRPCVVKKIRPVLFTTAPPAVHGSPPLLAACNTGPPPDALVGPLVGLPRAMTRTASVLMTIDLIVLVGLFAGFEDGTETTRFAEVLATIGFFVVPACVLALTAAAYRFMWRHHQRSAQPS
jgi:hypothetical protein